MANQTLAFLLYFVSIVFLVIRLKTGKKRDFILSVLFVVLGSAVFAFSNNFFILYAFLVAIVFSFIGDLLMAEWIKFTEHRTIDGIIAFGFAHLVYMFAFNNLNIGGFSFRNDWYLVIIGIIVGFVVYKVVIGGTEIPGEIKFSNMLYAGLISGLLVMVLDLVVTPLQYQYALLVKTSALIGVLLFIISDSVLAYNEFKRKIPHAKEIIAVTYIFAQILLQLTPVLLFLE